MNPTSDNSVAPPGQRPARLKHRSASRSVAINAASNWAGMGVNFVVKLFLVKYLYTHLGREDYGIYLVALSVTQMTAFIRFGLGGSVLRLASEGIAARDWQGLSDTLSVARTILAVGGTLAWGAAIVMSLFMLDVLSVPAESHASAAALIQMTGLGAACHILTTVYAGTLRAAQRYYLINTIVAGESLLTAAMVAVLFSLGYVNLEVLGLTTAVPAALALAGSALMVRRLLPEVHISFRRFTRAALGRVASLTAWIAISEVALVVHSQVGAPLVSATIGPAAVPMLAVPRQMITQFARAIAAMTQPLRPVATAMAVQGRRDHLARMYRMALRFTAVLMVPGIAILVVYGKPVIRFFTDAQMAADSYPVLVVYVTLFGLHQLSHPATAIVMGVGSVRGVALWQGGALLTGAALAAAVAIGTPWGIVGLVVALNVPMLFYSLGYMSVRIRQETGVSVGATLARGLGGPMMGGLVPVGLGLLLQWLWPVSDSDAALLVWLVVQMSVCGLAYLVAAWFAILDRDERATLRNLLPSRRVRPSVAGRGGPPPEPPAAPAPSDWPNGE
ncbi:MAG: lipopolysaccharide biosynthesis protein [Planctomycetes bacterium]|nr:lipopolysaccharide biosynthesis protein [Planctomycetota bacterium]